MSEAMDWDEYVVDALDTLTEHAAEADRRAAEQNADSRNYTMDEIRGLTPEQVNDNWALVSESLKQPHVATDAPDAPSSDGLEPTDATTEFLRRMGKRATGAERQTSASPTGLTMDQIRGMTTEQVQEIPWKELQDVMRSGR